MRIAEREDPGTWTEPGPNGASWCAGSAIDYRDEQKPCGYIMPERFPAHLFWAQRYCWTQGPTTIGTCYVESLSELTLEQAREFVEAYKDIPINESPVEVSL